MAKTKETSKGTLRRILAFLKQHYLIRNILYLFLTAVFLLLLLKFALNMYTHHGERIEMPELLDKSLSDVQKIADKYHFDVILYDSVQIVGKPGGIVLTQNPPTGSYVKSGRKIYLTISKYNADRFPVKLLPTLYGKKYSLKRQEIQDRFSVQMKVKGYKYDPGPIDHILEVYYHNRPIINRRGRNLKVQIAKGDTLEVVLSKHGGGEVPIPDLHCKPLAEAKFLIESLKLKVGKVNHMGFVDDPSTAYVVSQFPSFKSGEKIPMGAYMDLSITQEKPSDCP